MEVSRGSFSGGSALNDPIYVFASYNTLAGSQFASVNNLPSGYSIDYVFNGNSIALVPEPAAITIVGMALGLFCSRRKRPSLS